MLRILTLSVAALFLSACASTPGPVPAATPVAPIAATPPAEPEPMDAPSVATTAPVQDVQPSNSATTAVVAPAPAPTVAPAPPVAPVTSPTVAAAPRPPAYTGGKPAKPAAAAVPMPAAASVGGSLQGRISLSGARGIQVEPRDLADTVVYFVADSRVPTKPGRYAIYTRGKAFDPAVLAVPVGSTVSFPNSDPVRHNVYSATTGASFDLGIYGEGEAHEQVFSKPGLVVVNCNVHHNMQAHVLVLDTPFVARPDSSGAYQFSSLPAGRGTLYVWHPRASLLQSGVAIDGAISANRALTLTKPRSNR